MEDTVEHLGTKRQMTGLPMEEMRLAPRLPDSFAAFAQHAPGDVEAKEVDVVGKIAQVGAGAHADFEHAHAGRDLQCRHDFAAEVRLAQDDSIKRFSQIVAKGDAVV